MKNNSCVKFLCKDCESYNLCKYYHKRKKDSYICKNFRYPTPHGTWKVLDRDNAICPVCNNLNYIYGNFCKWCGANNRGEA